MVVLVNGRLMMHANMGLHFCSKKLGHPPASRPMPVPHLQHSRRRRGRRRAARPGAAPAPAALAGSGHCGSQGGASCLAGSVVLMGEARHAMCGWAAKQGC